jgi:hypothetical protein
MVHGSVIGMSRAPAKQGARMIELIPLDAGRIPMRQESENGPV